MPAVAVVLLLAGCGSAQDTLHAESPQAKTIASLWWWLMGGAWVGLGAVCGLLILSWLRRARMGQGRQPHEKAGWVVVLTFGVGVMVLGLVAVFVVGNYIVLSKTEEPVASATKLTVRAIGHQWFWEFEYPGTPHAITADEMHIPVRTPILLQATTADVIHSFWVPALNRKVDMIPGRQNRVLLYASTPGVYRGQC